MKDVIDHINEAIKANNEIVRTESNPNLLDKVKTSTANLEKALFYLNKPKESVDPQPEPVHQPDVTEEINKQDTITITESEESKE